MPEHADKIHNNQSRAVANQPSRRMKGGEATFSFDDNRPEARRNDRIQAKMSNSPQTKKFAQLQDRINNSPRMVAKRQQIDRRFGTAGSDPVQKQVMPDDEELQMKAERNPVQKQAMPDDELLQGKFEPVQRQDIEDDESIQGKSASGEAPNQSHGEPDSQRNNTGLPDKLKAGIENLSGASLDNVKVHFNSAKPARLQALAYTQGADIHVAPGQEQHLPHEAWHVVQQAQGRVKPTTQMAGMQVNDDISLEHDADVMGAKAVRETANYCQFKKDIQVENVSGATVQQVADMAARVTQKRKLNKVKKDLEAAVAASGNRYANVGEIDAHDRAQNAGVHHQLRPVRLNQLIGDIDRTLAYLTDLNLRDSDALGVEKKAGRGAGAVALQL